MKDEDEITARLSWFSSLLSIVTIVISLAGCVFVLVDIDTHLEEYGRNVEEFMNITSDASLSLDDEPPGRRIRRQFYQNNFRSPYGNRRGGNSVYPPDAFENGFSQSASQSRNGNRWRGGSRGGDQNCDCTVTQCPPGQRGQPGRDGIAAIDGLPGEPGKPGTDGIYLLDIQCEPCPRGKRGDPGPAGEQGPRGRTGPPGEPGIDGNNEPGTPGGPGARGQPGMEGKDGMPGHPGQDSITLIGQPGKKGPPGPPGFSGPRGDPGKSGEPAPPGKEGPIGPHGEHGEMGQEGPRGARGPIGIPGDNGGYCECPKQQSPLTSSNALPRPEAQVSGRKPSGGGSKGFGIDYSDTEEIQDDIFEQASALAQRRPGTDSNVRVEVSTPSTFISSTPYYRQRRPNWGGTVWENVPLPSAAVSSSSNSEQSQPQFSLYGSRGQQGRAPTAGYVIAPHQDYRKRYPMIAYLDSREQAKTARRRNSHKDDGDGSMVDFDLRR